MPYSKHTLETMRDEIKRRGVVRSMKNRMKPRGKYLAHLNLAKRREVVCTITFEHFLELTQKDECHWCLGPLPTSRAGLDRLDNNIGYVEGNCVPCCWSCNMMKGTLTGEQFIELCAKIARVAGERNAKR